MSSTPEPRWIQLAGLLIRQTEKGSLIWEETSADNSFQTIIGRNAIAITRYPSGEIDVEISDSSGKVVDKFEATELDSYLIRNEPFDDADLHSRLDGLYNRIQRNIAGADEILDSLIASLEAKDIEF